MFQNLIEVGYSQIQAGANGLVTQAFVIGGPGSVALTAGVFAPNCYLIELDTADSFQPVIWQNTGTTAAPAWTITTLNQYIASGATLTLTASQTGTTILLNQATGTLVTLPAPIVGLKFNFIVSVSVTSGSHKVITNTGTVFIAGMVGVMEAAATSAVGALFNGTTHISILMNGTTTGGLIGTRFTLECISTTVWNITGFVAGSGSLATPASTS